MSRLDACVFAVNAFSAGLDLAAHDWAWLVINGGFAVAYIALAPLLGVRRAA